MRKVIKLTLLLLVAGTLTLPGCGPQNNPEELEKAVLNISCNDIALIRIERPHYGTLKPEDFHVIAEDSLKCGVNEQLQSLIAKNDVYLPTNTYKDKTTIYLYKKNLSQPILEVRVGILKDGRGYVSFYETETGFIEFKLVQDDEFPRYILGFLEK